MNLKHQLNSTSREAVVMKRFVLPPLALTRRVVTETDAVTRVSVGGHQQILVMQAQGSAVGTDLKANTSRRRKYKASRCYCLEQVKLSIPSPTNVLLIYRCLLRKFNPIATSWKFKVNQRSVTNEHKVLSYATNLFPNRATALTEPWKQASLRSSQGVENFTTSPSGSGHGVRLPPRDNLRSSLSFFLLLPQ